MNITYYTFDNCINYLNHKINNKNFISFHLAAEYIKSVYTPQFHYPAILKDKQTFKEISEQRNVYHSSKKNKDKTPKIIGTENVPITIIDKDYSKFVDKISFHTGRYSMEFYDRPPEGYYEFKTGELTVEINEKDLSVNYSAPLFVKFIRAEKIYTPEIKEPGKPYQPSKNEIKVIEESEWYPVWEYGSNSQFDSIKYCISPCGGDNWSRIRKTVLTTSIFVSKVDIEIIEKI